METLGFRAFRNDSASREFPLAETNELTRFVIVSGKGVHYVETMVECTYIIEIHDRIGC